MIRQTFVNLGISRKLFNDLQKFSNKLNKKYKDEYFEKLEKKIAQKLEQNEVVTAVPATIRSKVKKIKKVFDPNQNYTLQSRTC